MNRTGSVAGQKGSSPLWRGFPMEGKNETSTMRLTLLITGLFVWAACSERPSPGTAKETKASDTMEHSQAATPPVDTAGKGLEHFKGLPPAIQGCSCYFSATEDRHRKGEYLFAASYDSTAFISVDGELVKLGLVSSTRKAGTFGDYDHTEVYRNDRYTVTVVIEYKGSSGDETWKNSGTITVESTGGHKVVERFVGECGC